MKTFAAPSPETTGLWLPGSTTPTYSDLKQGVLGASGNSGSLVVHELVDQGLDVVALGRNWSKQPFGDDVEYRRADVNQIDEFALATKGLGVLYVANAVPYDTRQWQEQWPVVMGSVIAAAKANKFKLVFLDNVFPYGLVDGPMTEDTPFKPDSKKGEVRAEIATKLQDAMTKGDVNATIGRSADFYGPNTSIGFRFFEKAIAGQTAVWLGKLGVLRTFSSLVDNAKALAILGNDARADGKVWHLPTDAARDGHYFVDLTERILGRSLDLHLLTAKEMEDDAARTGGPLQETHEMMYQYDFPYVFDSSRFQSTFGMAPTSYEDGFKQVLDDMRA